MLQEGRDWVCERIPEKNGCETEGTRNHKYWPLEHQKDQVGKGQSIEWLGINGCHDAYKDHFDDNSGDYYCDCTPLVLCKSVHYGNQEVLGILHALVAAWVFFLGIELLTSAMDLLGSHACKLGHFFFTFMLIAIVAAAPDDAYEVGW